MGKVRDTKAHESGILSGMRAAVCLAAWLLWAWWAARSKRRTSAAQAEL